MFEFGKYGIYIWACYGISALVLGGLTLYTFAAGSKAKDPGTDGETGLDENAPS